MKYSIYCDVCGHKITVFEDNTTEDKITNESRENFRKFAEEHKYEMVQCEACGGGVFITPELADQFTYVDSAPDDVMSQNNELRAISNE